MTIMAGVRWAGKRFMGLLLAGLLLVAGGYPALAASRDLHFQLYFVFSAPRDFYLVPVDVSVPDPTGEISASPSRQVAKALELLIQGPPAGSPLWCSLPKE
ncbi:MAG: hypothetical protein AB1816_05265, partial [Bacillota bacterium]